MIIKKTKAKYGKVKQFKLTTPFISRILIVFLTFVILAIFGIKPVLIIFLLISVFFNARLANFQAKKGLPTDFELSTFSTVMVTAAFGIKWGLFIAIFSKLFASLSTGNLLADHFFMMATYVNAVILTALFGGGNILLLGLIIAGINSVLMFLISKNILGLDITSNMSYTGTNLIFNLIIFSILTEPVKALLM